jgi:hypothetical protein
MIVYVSVGNSDDKMTQADWAVFQSRILSEVKALASEIHGVWYSAPMTPYQNMCICAEVASDRAAELKGFLTEAREYFGQDAVAWAEAPVTEMI